MNPASFLLGLYFGKQSWFTLGANLGSDRVSLKPFKHGWPRRHGWDRACGIIYYVPVGGTEARGFLQSSFEHA